MQCALKSISAAVQNAASLELSAFQDPGTSGFVSRRGAVVVGLVDMRERFGHLLSRADQHRLPLCLMDFVFAPGEHVLPGEDLVMHTNLHKTQRDSIGTDCHDARLTRLLAQQCSNF